ncbi:MAG: hypothetical protein H0V40_04465 [Actinobacteria bacterium]|nr:hypothetical protein [Actinomycetota bacterium]
MAAADEWVLVRGLLRAGGPVAPRDVLVPGARLVTITLPGGGTATGTAVL